MLICLRCGLISSFIHLVCYMYFPDIGSNLFQVVEEELKTEGSVKERQLQLLTSIISDVSEPNKELLKKLNCTPKCKYNYAPCTCKLVYTVHTVIGEEVYSLAVAVFNARNHGGGKFIIL